MRTAAGQGLQNRARARHRRNARHTAFGRDPYLEQSVKRYGEKIAGQTQAKNYSRPLPNLDEENRPWWEALQRHELYIQKCGKCGDTRYYPRALCTSCMSANTEWVKCSGR